MVRIKWGILAYCLLWAWLPASAQQGYDIVDDRIVVSGRSHWEHWKKPEHLTTIDNSGAVRPRHLRSIYNVLADPSIARPVVITNKDPRILNVDSTLKVDVLGRPLQDTQKNFVYDYLVRPGVSRAGSNIEMAANIVDGDPTTFWEPDPRDPIEQWWVEVDLGRAVPVEGISVRFVEEELGDPFFKYLLLLARNQTLSLTDDRKVSFELFVPHEGPNTQQRAFFFESASATGGATLASPVNPGLVLDPGGISSVKKLHQNSADPAWTGKVIETIRIVITDTRGGRAEQIDQAAWEALPAQERGDIVHFVRDFAGREEPVDAETYESLEEERRGRREFYRRELPRLAEVEVWGWGDNISLGLVEGGGTLDLTSAGKTPAPAFDGDINSRYQQPTQDPLNPGGNVLTIDIGGTVWLDQIRVVGGNIRGYQMRSSTGERDAQGKLRWRAITPPERVTNVDHGFYGYLNDVQDPVRKVRFLDLLTFANFIGDTQNRTDRFWSSFNELMLFAEGVPAEVELQSDLIELPGLVTLGSIHWEADTPPDTKVEIRTRTGDQLIQQIRFYDSNGIEKTAAEHKKLLAFLKGPIDTSFAIGPGWSAWSQQYQQPGDQVTSPSLRKFMQIQARLLSEDRQIAPALESLSVELHTPSRPRAASRSLAPRGPSGSSGHLRGFRPTAVPRAAHLGPQPWVRRDAHQRRSGTRYAAYRCGNRHRRAVCIWSAAIALGPRKHRRPDAARRFAPSAPPRGRPQRHRRTAAAILPHGGRWRGSAHQHRRPAPDGDLARPASRRGARRSALLPHCRRRASGSRSRGLRRATA